MKYDEKLTVLEAYRAMFNFLEHYYELGNSESDDIATLLSSMQINLYDNLPMDHAMWQDWLKSIKKAVKSGR